MASPNTTEFENQTLGALIADFLPEDDDEPEEEEDGDDDGDD